MPNDCELSDKTSLEADCATSDKTFHLLLNSYDNHDNLDIHYIHDVLPKLLKLISTKAIKANVETYNL